ncbi:MAG TPA: signal peptide peptidase SppA [Acidobacteriaceae bacterium]|nr:signal peptide peptidase SppA [Acidobacteriaceae bacterium]
MDEPLTPPTGEPSAPAESYPPPPPGYQAAWSAPPSYPTPPPKRRRVWLWVTIGGVLAFGFIVLCSVLLWSVARTLSGGQDGIALGDSIGVIDIDGEILSADVLVDQLRKYDQDDDIKAIVLHINSPGGGAAASQEIYHEVLKIREHKRKPVVASIESVGASGAYYIASAANTIYANDASVVGSIGVIMEWTNYGDLLSWAKMKPEVIHAGALKDAGDPTHAMTPEERVYFQSLVDNMYGQFIADVAKGRNLQADQIKGLATGQVWTGQQALPLHLIDKEGGFRDALLATAKQVGISGEPSVVKPAVHHRSVWDLIDNANDLVHQPQQMLERRPGFYFLWR